MDKGIMAMIGMAAGKGTDALLALRWKWTTLALTCAALFGAVNTWMAAWLGVELALRWLLLAGSLAAYLLWVLWRSLEHNRRAGEQALLPGLGAGNLLTFVRGMLVAGLAGFLLLPRPEGWQAWIPGGLYTAAALLDFMDGYLARVQKHATRLGELLDMNVDGLGVLAASSLVVSYGQVPGWYLLVGLARYLWLAAIWLRQRLGKPVAPLPPSTGRRAIAGLQMGFLFVMLWPLFTPPGTHLAAALFAIPFLGGFLRDWLAVTGVIQPGRMGQAAWLGYVKQWLPVALRAAVVALLAGQVVSRFSTGQGYALQGMAETAVALLVGLGIAGRAAAILGLCLLGASQMHASLSANQLILIGLETALVYLGSGAWSLWRPEEYWITHRAGER